MREFDNDCLIMCKIQGEIFEKSIELCTSSSSIFIKRYMNAYPALSMDKESFLIGSLSALQVIDLLNEEYPNPYGKEKYSKEEMYWIGYIYRCWSYVYNQRSKDIIKICSPKKMRELYFVYHSLDPIMVVDRILEARDIKYENDMFKKTETLISMMINS